MSKVKERVAKGLVAAEYQITLTLTAPLLGTVPKDPEVYRNYIAGKAALDDEQLAQELATVEKIEEKGWTGFHMKNGNPIIYDYAIKGFFKDCCSMLRRVKGSISNDITAFKKIIDGLVFVRPRQIPIIVNGKLGVLERPLRAQTAQGERVALSRSDCAPAGSTLTFNIKVLGEEVSEETLREWLDYGADRGLGQWRNGGYGTFSYELSKA